MTRREVRVLEAAELQALGDAWDALPTRRGVQADFYDSYAWFASWLHTAGEQAAAVRVPAVLEGDSPVALLPMVARTSRRWESAGSGLRTRYRPVLGLEDPDAGALARLAEAVARAGARELALHRLPARDPATAALLAALRSAGFRAYQRQRSSDCLALVESGWVEHRKRFATYDRSVRTKTKRLRALWGVTVEEYGSRTGRPVADGFAVYADIQRRSWKGPLPEQTRAQRLELLRHTEALGWARLYVLEVAGAPAAAHVWFRVGSVATWLSTAYDQRLAALSPGSIIMWEAQERLFAESPPRLVDFLPGHNPQKDSLGPDRSPLVIVEAVRRTVVSGATFPARRQVRYVAPAVAARVRARLRRPQRNGSGEGLTWVRDLEVAPPDGAPPADDALPGERLEPNPRLHRYLAVVAGHPSPEKLADSWAPGDSWWRLGSGPAALARLGPATGPSRVVKEIVLFDGWSGPLEALLCALATATGGAVRVTVAADGPTGEKGTPASVRTAPLPWPDARS
jgi:CelD/BcsL family acetyltransferase involved in cellulose biosynthesis